MPRYTCDKPPCLHVVVDYSDKKYAVFLEDSEGELIWVRGSEVLRAASLLEKYAKSGFREARGEEVDELAYSQLEALPLEKQ